MHSGRSMSESAPGHHNDHQQVSRPHRFFSVIPRPRDFMLTNRVSRGTAGFLGKAFDPYTLFPEGDDMDMSKMDR